MLNRLERVLERMCSEWTERGYEVLLEADACGWLFHLFMLDPNIIANQVHLDTRVRGVRKGAKYDLAIGPLCDDGQRPCVDSLLVVEAKVFPENGFTDQQHRVHFEHVLNDDLPKLAELADIVQHRIELLVDGRDYLMGTYQGKQRLEYLKCERDNVASGVPLIVLRIRDKKWVVDRF